MPYDDKRFPGKKILKPEFLPGRVQKNNKKEKTLHNDEKKCPNCGKIQNIKNKSCENCNLDFDIAGRIIRIIKNGQDEDRILIIVKNEKKLQFLENVIKENNLEKTLKILYDGTYEELTENHYPECFYDEINTIIDINKLLNSYYHIPVYNNVYSSRYLENVSVLKNDVEYISNYDNFNIFINTFQEYIDFITSLGISHNNFSDLNCFMKKIQLFKDEISELNQHILELYEIYDLYGVEISNSFNENIRKIDDLEILNENPYLIDEEEKNIFLDLLKKYKEINNKNKDSKYYITTFKDKNRYIEKLIHSYINHLSEYNLDMKIININKEFDKLGLNLYNIINFGDYEEVTSFFNNPQIIESDDSYLLDKKFEEYFKKSDINFSDYFNKYRKKLEKLIKQKIKEIANKNQNNNSDEINILANQINAKLKDLSINVDTINNFEENENNIKILMENPKLIEDYNLFKSLSTFYAKEGNKYIDLTFEEYFINNYKNLLEIINIFSEKIDEKYNPNNFNRVKMNIKKINTITNKLEIDMKSVNLTDLHNYPKTPKMKLLISSLQSTIDRLNLNSLKNNKLNVILYYSNTKINEYNNIISLKNDILNEISESVEIEEKINSTTYLIKKCYDLKNKLNLEEYKQDIDQISYNFRILNMINDNIPLKNITELISDLYKKYKIDLNFTSSYYEGLFDENTLISISSENIENEISELDLMFNRLNYLIKDKNKKFSDITSDDYNDINYFYRNTTNKIKNCNIFNFNDTVTDLKKELSFKTNDIKLNEIIQNVNLISDIINLSVKLKIDNAKCLFNFSYENLIGFHEQLKQNIKFTNFYNKGLYNNNIFQFYQSPAVLNDLNKISHDLNSISTYLKENNIPTNVLMDSEIGKSEDLVNMNRMIDETYELYNIETEDNSQNIKNMRIIINNLIDLCEKYPIQENNSMYLDKLSHSKDKINKYYEINLYEKLIDSHDKLINYNLNRIWKGYSTNINKIKNKFDIDLIFTKAYNQKIFSLKTIDNMNNFTKNDAKTLKNLKLKLSAMTKKIYSNETYTDNNLYNINESLIKKISRLDESNITTETIDALTETNEILKNNELKNLINILKVKINKPQDYEYMIDLEKQLDKYASEKYDYSEDGLDKLYDNIKYSQLINLGIINDNEHLIKNDLNNFLLMIKQFGEYRRLIIERILNISEFHLKTEFNLILNQISEKRIFLLNEKTLQRGITKQFVNQFDKIVIFNDCKKSKLSNALRKKEILIKFRG